MDIPYTSFNGNLKFTRSGTAEEIATDAFQFLAPGFFDVPEKRKISKIGSALLKAAGKMGFETMFYDMEPKRRRFAGDQTLSRGSYYAVCCEGSNSDEGLLVNEINAYRIPEKHGFTIVVDLDDEAIANKFNNGVREFQFLILIADVDLFVKQYPKYKDLVTCKNNLAVKHPYTTEYREINKVIDLRLPLTREWFFETFRNGDGVFYKKLQQQTISSFYEMLPALLHVNIGGQTETQGIGIWMRRNKVNAFIYPSARSNAEVVIRNGVLERHSGWNLLDYRNTDERTFADTLTDWSSWSTEVFKGFHCEIASANSIFNGSFKITGNEEFHLALHDERLKNKNNR
jgi:hypothetical protein